MSISRISNQDFIVSVILMLCSAVSLSLVALLGKELTTLIDFSVLVFLRFFIPFLILLWIAIILFDEKVDFSQWRIHIFRSLLTVSSQYCLFFYLLNGSLLVGTLLFTTSGLFLPFISYLCFRTEIKIKTCVATVVSFMGVAFILHSSGGMSWIIFVGLLSGFLNACSQVTMHYSSKRGSAFDVTLMMFAFSSLYTLVIVLILGKLPTLTALFMAGTHDMLWVIIVSLAILTISNQALRTKAYRYVNKPASLTPFYYMTIIFSAVLDWVYYDKSLQWNTYIGFLFIFIAAIGMSWRGHELETKTQQSK
ncbi:DMT family transporter [Shewanella surugensis]|uniref:DMT family transporter n=1 Tax=Shewanella surugensis TaxID=212020 RepID=A0ABT0LIQ8_9GAMM|nr:DMT family transporter [Shewanella surugensis]MCL1127582.1 DMT family transporter [Shewanella surugensis]